MRGEGLLWDGGERWPGSMTQLSVWQLWLLRHRCRPSAFYFCPALCPHHWTILHVICWSLRQECMGLQGVKQPPHNSFTLQGALRLHSSALGFVILSLFTSLSHAIRPPPDALVHRSVRLTCVQVGCYLLGCRYSACWNFKDRDHGDPSFCHVSGLCAFCVQPMGEIERYVQISVKRENLTRWFLQTLLFLELYYISKDSASQISAMEIGFLLHFFLWDFKFGKLHSENFILKTVGSSAFFSNIFCYSFSVQWFHSALNICTYQGYTLCLFLW